MLDDAPYLKTLKEIEKAGILTGGLEQCSARRAWKLPGTLCGTLPVGTGATAHLPGKPGYGGAEKDRLADGREDREVLCTSLQGAHEWPGPGDDGHSLRGIGGLLCVGVRLSAATPSLNMQWKDAPGPFPLASIQFGCERRAESEY